ncbi:MAG: hypothetical protein ABI690_04750 [Chloroflexota bacterium]
MKKLPPKLRAGSTGSATVLRILAAEKRREAREAPPGWQEFGENTGAIRRCVATRIFRNWTARIGEVCADFDKAVLPLCAKPSLYPQFPAPGIKGGGGDAGLGGGGQDVAAIVIEAADGVGFLIGRVMTGHDENSLTGWRGVLV